MRIYILLKRNILTIVFGLFLVFLIIFSKNNLSAAKDGLTLWATCVVPSLFPFFIATELLNYTNIAQILGKLLSKIMRPIFNIPGEGAYAFIMGIISGYPVGAKIVAEFYSNGICTKNEAERMLAFTNNSGPLFVIGTVGVLLFGNSTIGILLFITHLLASITVGCILGISSRAYKLSEKKLPYSNTKQEKLSSSFSNLGNILGNSIHNAISTVLLIGGFVVLFSVILSILNRLNIITIFSNLLGYFSIPYDFSRALISGIIELTNGVNIASGIHAKVISTNIILCAFLLGFGGFSVLLQVLSIISKFGLSIKTYFLGKLLQGLFAAFYTLIFINKFSIFNIDIPINLTSSNSTPLFNIFIIVFMIIFGVVLSFINQKKIANHNI
ncbi:MAG: sporulation integral membrane protein YlbJ [Clostridia bacterium]|nr:sporulation integral membrane protein YlbJ [Clostridia bacterium]